MSTVINSARIAVLGLALTGAVIPFAASATTNTAPSCTVAIVGRVNIANDDPTSRFTLHDSKVSSKFVVTGDENCKSDVTLVAWTAPNGVKGMPYSEQRVYSYATGSFGPGTHSLTTKAPDCYYQFDLVRGATPTAVGGGLPYESGRMLGSAHGGTKSCVVATPSPTPTPVVPTPTPTPEVLAAATVLPQTGGSDLSGILGVTSMTVAALAYIRSRRA